MQALVRSAWLGSVMALTNSQAINSIMLLKKTGKADCWDAVESSADLDHYFRISFG